MRKELSTSTVKLILIMAVISTVSSNDTIQKKPSKQATKSEQCMQRLQTAFKDFLGKGNYNIMGITFDLHLTTHNYFLNSQKSKKIES